MINKIENPTNLYLSVVKLGKLQELTDSMELIGEKDDSSKISMLKDSLADNLVGDNKAVVFTRFSRMADILVRELKEYNPAVITGAVKDRQVEIDKLNNDPKCKVIVITTAGNEGINLERANMLYMVDVPLGSYGSLIQTIGRVKRIGQVRPMVVYYLMADKSVDIKLKNLLLKKQEMSEKIFGSLAEIREVLE
jgi:SNF2 family DNA or RNA helicase